MKLLLAVAVLLVVSAALSQEVKHNQTVEPKQVAPAAQNRNLAGGNGDNFDTNLGNGATAQGGLEILSDTMGVDFGPYLSSEVLSHVRQNWYNLIPEVARPPIMKRGKVAIEFSITKDGSVAGMRVVASSGDIAMDRAAWGGITASNPFPPLPIEFKGQYLALRFSFYYNPDPNPAPTVEQCRADQKLWMSVLERESGPGSFGYGDLHGWSHEMQECMTVDPKNKSLYYNTGSEAISFRLIRLTDFLRRHGLVDQFFQEDAQGKR